MLRAGLLEGVSVAVARAGGDGTSAVADAVSAICSQLGAGVSDLELADTGAGEVSLDEGALEAVLEQAVDGVLGDVGRIDLLAVDAAGVFAGLIGGGAGGVESAGGAGRDALVGSLQACWNVTRTVVNRAFLADGRGGRIVYLAPRPDAGAHAGAACAGLQNLARTLSIEWARHQITPVTVAPGVDTGEEQIATLVAYLASPAGAYFSGCLLDLTGVRAPERLTPG